MKKTILFFIISILLTGCQTKTSNFKSQFSNPDKINVIVSILPQMEFVKSVGGDHVDVMSMVREGFDPATYEPTPEQLKLITQADIYFLVGHIGFESQYLEKIKTINPNLTIIDTSDGISTRSLEDHYHENEEEKHNEFEADIDPHTWISPILVQTQVENIYQALVKIDPQNQSQYSQNKEQYVHQLQQLHQELAQSFTPLKGKTFFVYHPAFGYLADQYGLVQEHIQIEGKEPSAADIQQVIGDAKSENVRVIFVQKQFSTQAANAIAEEIDGVVVALDPLSPNYLDNMHSISQTIVTNLSQ